MTHIYDKRIHVKTSKTVWELNELQPWKLKKREKNRRKEQEQ